MRNRRVLIAEDIYEQRELLKIKLRAAPFRVDFAPDGAVAVELFREACASDDPYDLVLLDGAMPILSGLGAAEKMLEQSPECKTKIYFLTNLPTDDPTLNLRIRMMNLNPRRHLLPKNENVENLIGTIIRLFDEAVEEEHGNATATRNSGA